MRINTFKVQTALMGTGMQQEHFAREAKISESTLYNVLSGGKCSQRTLSRIARAAGVDVSELTE
ncbi:MAG: helix-turn-helix transcriptional regulator [Oscillospiraceae bacterium]|nr:helix-turn-helix transcriptional regulator [Oscillospiraceae bacterium]